MKDDTDNPEEVGESGPTLSTDEEFTVALEWASAALTQGEIRLELGPGDRIQIRPSVPGGWDAVALPEAEDRHTILKVIHTELSTYINANIADDIEAALKSSVPDPIWKQEGGVEQLIARCEVVNQQIPHDGMKEWKSTRRQLQGNCVNSVEWSVAKGLASSAEGAGGPTYGIVKLGLGQTGEAGKEIYFVSHQDRLTFKRPEQKTASLILHSRDVDRLIQDLTHLREELQARERDNNGKPR